MSAARGYSAAQQRQHRLVRIRDDDARAHVPGVSASSAATSTTPAIALQRAAARTSRSPGRSGGATRRDRAARWPTRSAFAVADDACRRPTPQWTSAVRAREPSPPLNAPTSGDVCHESVSRRRHRTRHTRRGSRRSPVAAGLRRGSRRQRAASSARGRSRSGSCPRATIGDP